MKEITRTIILDTSAAMAIIYQGITKVLKTNNDFNKPTSIILFLMIEDNWINHQSDILNRNNTDSPKTNWHDLIMSSFATENLEYFAGNLE